MWTRIWLLASISLTFHGLVGHAWQHFQWTGLRTGAVDHVTGQVALYLAAATTVLLLLALPARRAIWRWPALACAWLTLGWVLVAPMLADLGLQLLAMESVQLVTGHELTLLGSLATALGALALAAREPLPPSTEPWVHVEISWRDRPLADRWLPPGAEVVVGQHPGRSGFELPASSAPQRHSVIVPTRSGPAVVGHPSTATTYGGELVAFNGAPSVLELGQPAIAEWGDVCVQCTLERVPQRVGWAGGPRLDERLIAAILVSAAVQVLLIVYATLSWSESAERTVRSATPRTTEVGAVVRQVYEPR